MKTIGNYVFTSNPYQNPYCGSSFTGLKFASGSQLETIGDYAFGGKSTGMTGDITIPSTVRTIGESAFNWLGASSMNGSLTLGGGESLDIGAYAFYNCGFNGNLTLLNGVSSIGNYAFQNASKLTGSLIIPGSVKTIGANGFASCQGFRSLQFAEDSVLTSIGNNAFTSWLNVTGDITIPKTVQTIGDSAFYSWRRTNDFVASNPDTNFNLTLGSGDKDYPLMVGGNAFYGLYYTGTLTLLEGVTQLGKSNYGTVFSGSHFTGPLVIPSSMRLIGQNVFSNCTGFTSLTIKEGEVAKDENGTLIAEKDANGVLIKGLEICYGAFYNCTGMTGDLIVPDSVITLDYMAFNGCTGFDGDFVVTRNWTSPYPTFPYVYSSNFKNIYVPIVKNLYASYSFNSCTLKNTTTIYAPEGLNLGNSANAANIERYTDYASLKAKIGDKYPWRDDTESYSISAPESDPIMEEPQTIEEAPDEEEPTEEDIDKKIEEPVTEILSEESEPDTEEPTEESSEEETQEPSP